MLLAALHECMWRTGSLHSGTPNSFFLVEFRKEKPVNFRALPGWKSTSFTTIPDPTHRDIPARRLPVPVSRRQFARTAAGSAFAAAVGSRLWTPSPVEAASFAPVPIPGGTPALGGAYHVFGPAAFDPPMQNPPQSQILMPRSDWPTSAAW